MKPPMQTSGSMGASTPDGNAPSFAENRGKPTDDKKPDLAAIAKEVLGAN